MHRRLLFIQLPLYIATYAVYRSVPRPGSDEWISTRCKATYKLVLQQIVDDEGWTEGGIPWSMDDAIRAWRHIRKNKKLRITCQVAREQGPSCFYASRGVGPCSDEVQLDRIIPGSRGGVYSTRNCLIACSSHNNARSDRSIEDFLTEGWRQQLLLDYEARQCRAN